MHMVSFLEHIATDEDRSDAVVSACCGLLGLIFQFFIHIYFIFMLLVTKLFPYDIGLMFPFALKLCFAIIIALPYINLLRQSSFLA